MKFKYLSEISKELIEVSKVKRINYPFRRSYFDKLNEKWLKKPAKCLIELEDLPDYYIIRFNGDGNKYLFEILRHVKKKYGLDRIHRKEKVNFYLINESICKRVGGLTVKTLKSYINFLANHNPKVLDISRMKRNIIEIKANPTAQSLRLKGLPIDLNDEKWAPIFGIILDSYLKSFMFAAEDKNFAGEIVKSLKKGGINSKIKISRGMFCMKGFSIISKILNLGGIETNCKQIIANNALPKWIFSCSKEYHAILLSKFLDTEGHVSKRYASIRIAQSSHLDINEDDRSSVLTNCKKYIIKPSGKESKVIIFSELNKEFQEKVLQNPSLMLISIQLLLKLNNIYSYVYPVNVYISSNEKVSVGWHLNITGANEVKKFFNLCGKFISVRYKKEDMKNVLSSQKRKQIPVNLRKPYFLLQAQNIEKCKGYFTSEDLIVKTGKKAKTINNLLGNMTNQNLIQSLGLIRRFKMRTITENGKNYLRKISYLDMGKIDQLVST